jgi:hypothetical protein
MLNLASVFRGIDNNQKLDIKDSKDLMENAFFALHCVLDLGYCNNNEKELVQNWISKYLLLYYD